MVQRRLRAQPAAPAARRRRWPAELPPGSFAAVMATGIISVAAHQHRQDVLSTALFMAALSTYAVLAAVMIARLIRWPPQLRRALAAPSARFGALTIVAASGVLGVRAVLGGAVWAGEALEVVAVLTWAPLGIWAVAGVLAARRSWRHQAGGTWLLLVVATESLAVLAATLATVRPSPALAVVGLCWLGLGLAYYLPLTGLVGARLLSARPRLPILTPDHWILSGALSIATLAASRLRVLAADGPLPTRARPWLTGLAVAVWLPASGLYLVLAVVSAWRSARLPATLRYGLDWWAMAFPLGMYAAATNDLGVNTGSGALVALAAVAFWIALASWLLVAAGLLRQGARWWGWSRPTAPGVGITLPPSPASLPHRKAAAAGRCRPADGPESQMILRDEDRVPDEEGPHHQP